MNKETLYSLRIAENYKEELETPANIIIEKVLELMMDYLKFIPENMKLKNTDFSKFIIIRGLDTMINVFNHTLLYTKNMDLTYFHCQKSFYCYVEFVSQISEDEKMFLQLSSRDACTYVYKKTLFEINNELKNKVTISKDMREKLDIVNQFIELYKMMISNLINNNIKNVHLADDLSRKLNTIYKKVDLIKLNKMVDKLFLCYDTIVAYELIELLFKKLAKKPEKIDIINQKLIEMIMDIDKNKIINKNIDGGIDIDKTASLLIN